MNNTFLVRLPVYALLTILSLPEDRLSIVVRAFRSI